MNKLLQFLIDAIMSGLMKGLNNVSGVERSDIKITNEEIRILDGLWEYLCIIAFGMVVIFFIAELNKTWALNPQDMTIKTVMIPLLKFAIIICLLCYSGEILSKVVAVCNNMAETITISTDANVTTEMNTVATSTQSTAEDVLLSISSFFTKLMVALMLLVSLLLNIVLKVVWWYKVIMYKLEMVFRIGIAPICVADAYSGLNSNTVRYIKGFLALGIYGVSLVILPSVANQLALAAFRNALIIDSGADLAGSVFDVISALIQIALVAPFAAISASSVVKQLAKEALGA